MTTKILALTDALGNQTTGFSGARCGCLEDDDELEAPLSDLTIAVGKRTKNFQSAHT
jgi:hypothetical protein